MFREMRRKQQALSREECVDILNRSTSGVLALSGDDGYPYALPISYVFDEDKMYFHSALEGHKIDAVKGNDRASFCVIDLDDVLPEKYTTCYRSVVIFGRIRILEDEQDKMSSIEKLAVKYAPDASAESRREEIERFKSRFCMLELTCEHISGKEGIELTRKRAENNSF